MACEAALSYESALINVEVEAAVQKEAPVSYKNRKIESYHDEIEDVVVGEVNSAVKELAPNELSTMDE